MCAQRFQCNHVYLSDKLLLEGARTLVQEGEGCDHAHTERLTNVEGSLKVMLLHLHTPNGNTVHMDVENKSGKHNCIYIYILQYIQEADGKSLVFIGYLSAKGTVLSQTLHLPILHDGFSVRCKFPCHLPGYSWDPELLKTCEWDRWRRVAPNKLVLAIPPNASKFLTIPTEPEAHENGMQPNATKDNTTRYSMFLQVHVTFHLYIIRHYQDSEKINSLHQF